jgi:hypothetical protein
MTIVQGDAHVWNYFVPCDGTNGVRLFGWNSWRVHVPAVDLGDMMAMPTPRPPTADGASVARSLP